MRPTVSAPFFTTVLKDVRVDSTGSSTKLECMVEGYPKPEVIWQRSGRIVGKSRNVRMTRAGNRCSLEIGSVQESDLGIYECVAVNIAGKAITRGSLSFTASGSRKEEIQNGTSLKLNNWKDSIRSRSVERENRSPPFRLWRSPSNRSSNRTAIVRPSTESPNLHDDFRVQKNKTTSNHPIGGEYPRGAASKVLGNRVISKITIPDVFKKGSAVEETIPRSRKIDRPTIYQNGQVPLVRNGNVTGADEKRKPPLAPKENGLATEPKRKCFVVKTCYQVPSANRKNGNYTSPQTERSTHSNHSKTELNGVQTNGVKSIEDSWSFPKFSTSRNNCSDNDSGVKLTALRDKRVAPEDYPARVLKNDVTTTDVSCPVPTITVKKNVKSSPVIQKFWPELETAKLLKSTSSVSLTNSDEHVGRRENKNYRRDFCDMIKPKTNDTDVTENTDFAVEITSVRRASSPSVAPSHQNRSHRSPNSGRLSIGSDVDKHLGDGINAVNRIAPGYDDATSVRKAPVPSSNSFFPWPSSTSERLTSPTEKTRKVPEIFVQKIFDEEEDNLVARRHDHNLERTDTEQMNNDTHDDHELSHKDSKHFTCSASDLDEEFVFENTHQEGPGLDQQQQITDQSNQLQPARVNRGPQSVTVLRGESVTLAIHYTGWPQPNVIWMKAGRILSDAGHHSILVGKDMSALSISEVTADDAGKYVVSVENEAGGDSRFASVAVVGIPEPPGGEPTASEFTDHSLVLSWYGSMYDGGSVVTGYVVEMCAVPDMRWQKVTHSVNTSCEVQGLSCGQQYVFRIRAENRYGLSNPSRESQTICLDEYVDGEAFRDDNVELQSDPVIVEPGTLFSERYELKEEVGKGKFGTVFRCVEQSTGRPRAAKMIRCIRGKEKVLQEIEIMNMLHHPKLLKLVAAFENSRNMILVTEYISGGELFERVIAHDFVLTESDCVLFVRQICDAVAYMHSCSVLHLDLKPENILCKTRTSHQIKIIDFGLAKTIKPDENLRVLFGTPEFVAPEVIGYEPVGPASDMWSIGVICYVLLSGLSPFMGDTDPETFTNITRAEFDFDEEAFENISNEAKDFISKLLIKMPRRRMTSEESLKHPWLMRVSWMQENPTPLSTEKLKKFIIRRKWQKSGTAIRALGRMVSLSRSSASSTSGAGGETTTSSSIGSAPVIGSPHAVIRGRSETLDSIDSEVFRDSDSTDLSR